MESSTSRRGNIDRVYQDCQRFKHQLNGVFGKIELKDSLSSDEEKRIRHLLDTFSKTKEKLKELSEEELFERKTWNIRLREVDSVYEDMSETFEKLRKKYLSQDDDEYHLIDPYSNPVEELEHNNKIMEKSLKITDNLRSMGGSIVNNLAEQREILRHGRNKVLDMGVTLGLSESTIRMIKRRLKCDAAMVFAGMCFIVLLILYFVYRSWGR